MKKIKIGKSIRDVISEEEFIRRSKYDLNSMQELSNDTAVEKNGVVFPVLKSETDESVGVYTNGIMSFYNKPNETTINREDYNSNNIIDFESNNGLKGMIEKQAKYRKAENELLSGGISPENIFQPPIRETDLPEMKLFKQAVTMKQIDFDDYKPRLLSDFNNKKRSFEQPGITFPNLKRLCNVLDIRCEIKFYDKPGCANPIGEVLSTVITD